MAASGFLVSADLKKWDWRPAYLQRACELYRGPLFRFCTETGRWVWRQTGTPVQPSDLRYWGILPDPAQDDAA